MISFLVMAARDSIRKSFDALEQHNTNTEVFLKEQADKFLKVAEQDMVEMSEYERAEYKEHEWDNYRLNTNTFRQIHRTSTLFSIYSTFEFELKKLTERCIKEKKVPDIKKKKGESIIGFYIRVLEPLLTDENKRKDRKWKQLDRLRLIRNALVHSNGDLNLATEDEYKLKTNNTIIEYSKTCEFVNIKQPKMSKGVAEIELIDGFGQFAISSYRKFMEDIVDDINNKLREKCKVK